MKKIAIALLALLLFVVLLCSCASAKHDSDRLKLVDRVDDIYVYADMQTGVEYVFAPRGGICPLIDSYGAPLVFPGFDAREDRPDA